MSVKSEKFCLAPPTLSVGLVGCLPLDVYKIDLFWLRLQAKNLTFENSFESSPKGLGSSKILLFAIGTIGLRGPTRAVASLGCKGAISAITQNISPHVSPRQGPTPTCCAATAGGISTVETCVSAAAKALPTTPTREW